MYQNGYQEYVDNEILSAEPMRLVQLMYQGALEAVSAARTALRAGDITARSRKISKAHGILNELATSLDHSAAPELCRNLVELYDYLLRRLVEANIEQTDGPLAEVETLLGTLLQGWEQAAQTQMAASAATNYSPGQLSYAY